MKISKNYVLRINDYLGTAVWGSKEYDKYISDLNIDIGRIIDCNLSDLKFNITHLQNRGYKVYRYNKTAKEILHTYNKPCIYKALRYLKIYG